MAREAAPSANRDRLLVAASRLIHQRGFARTRLADVATEAGVALGSVYFYFRSKDDIAVAIVDRRLERLERALATAAGKPDPVSRLDAVIAIWADDREIDATYGCPIGSLCYELSRRRGALGAKAGEPLRVLLRWCEQRFDEMGMAGESPGLAAHLVMALQGASLVGHAFGDPPMIAAETDRLKAWIRALAPPSRRRAHRARTAAGGNRHFPDNEEETS